MPEIPPARDRSGNPRVTRRLSRSPYERAQGYRGRPAPRLPGCGERTSTPCAAPPRSRLVRQARRCLAFAPRMAMRARAAPARSPTGGTEALRESGSLWLGQPRRLLAAGPRSARRRARCRGPDPPAGSGAGSPSLRLALPIRASRASDCRVEWPLRPLALGSMIGLSRRAVRGTRSCSPAGEAWQAPPRNTARGSLPFRCFVRPGDPGAYRALNRFSGKRERNGGASWFRTIGFDPPDRFRWRHGISLRHGRPPRIASASVFRQWLATGAPCRKMLPARSRIRRPRPPGARPSGHWRPASPLPPTLGAAPPWRCAPSGPRRP